MIRQSDKDRFWSKVDKSGDCWEWTANKNRGYGLLFRAKGISPWRAHRFSWMIHNGEIPKGLCVCHHCDNPGCVNPEHLFLGTQKDNMIDAYRKGRIDNFVHGSGEDNNAALLTNLEVKALRDDFKNGLTYRELEEKYGLSDVAQIVRNISYYDPEYKPINANARPRPTRKYFTPSDVTRIKEAYGRLKSQRKVAKLFGTNKTTIGLALKGEY